MSNKQCRRHEVLWATITGLVSHVSWRSRSPQNYDFHKSVKTNNNVQIIKSALSTIQNGNLKKCVQHSL